MSKKIVDGTLGFLSGTGTDIPFSFYINEEDLEEIFAGKVNDEQWMVLRKGAVIYDVALAQIAWAYANKNILDKAYAPIKIYNKGCFRYLNDIRAWYGGNETCPYRYNREKSGEVPRGEGYVFKIIPATGEYAFDLEFFINDKKIIRHCFWKDWFPISGENAWAGVIAPLHVYSLRKKINASSNELELAEDIARMAGLLQAENGGIRMAPLGTWSEEDERQGKTWKERDWWYRQISTENNLSWYAAFRMLHQVTDEEKYKESMESIGEYLRWAYMEKEDSFAQGAYYSDVDGWIKNKEFATDCQTWAICVLSPELIDKWFKKGVAYRLWKETREKAGVYDNKGKLLGVDFTDYCDLKKRFPKRKPMVSYEWTGGAILAVKMLEEYYSLIGEREYADECREDRENMENFVKEESVLFKEGIAWPYASGNQKSIERPTGFGWYAPPEKVLSMASTAWMALIEENINPFFL